MKKIEAIIRTARFAAVKEALSALGVQGITVTHVQGEVLGYAQTFTYRCQQYRIDLTERLKVEVVVGSREADDVIQAVIAAARTGEIDDGQIFVYDVAEAIRICNCQRDEAAV
jgi:nitrogen regulatory protein P-II 1